MEKYDPQKIEKKWQEIWDKNPGIFHGEDLSKKPKHYQLVEFPYPSGAGLHVGHCMGYGASDAYSRMKRMQGYNVMFPIGWDAFGLPTENFAIKTGRKPEEVTKENTDNFRRQMKRMGLSFDWDREVNTTDPDYYRWTQWIFLQFYKHAVVDGKLIEVADNDKTTPRLAFQAEIAINWCPSCKIGLANEEVVAGKCERCGAETIKKMQKQWMLRITKYADRLISDLDMVDYLPKIKAQQINWIGRSEGTNIKFQIVSSSGGEDQYVEVFTTRADTLFGCTYIVLAPEHPMLQNSEFRIQNSAEVQEYINSAKKKSDLERTDLVKDKTGVRLDGVKVINPINNEEVEVWVADYVLASYGTGAVMAVPAHDERDWEFARKFNIPIEEVIIPKLIDPDNPHKEGKKIVARNSVQAILINPKNNQILSLKWKNFPWTTFVVGGIEEGENPEEAARREILEETGYKNIIFKKILGGPIQTHFFAAHKDVNRIATFNIVVFELENDEKEDISDQEKALHELNWTTWDEMQNDPNIRCSEFAIIRDRFFNPPHAFTDYGYLINSDSFNGLTSAEAKKKITEKLKLVSAGSFSVNYKLRDWVFSRQHYWGEPIPIVHCKKCGTVPLRDEDLPVKLPEVENYQPTNTGESPLAAISDWVNTTCPVCDGPAKRETDTMPNWAGSSWYFLAYTMKNTGSKLEVPKDKNIFSEKKDMLDYWMPVDLYNGGMEHTTLHLLYSRFWHKFLFDLGYVSMSEPYQRRIAHGIILGPDGRKMSKSFGNVINPDDIVQQYGADTTRAYIMFIGPYDQESAWSTAGVQGVYRFLTRIYNNFEKIISSDVTDSKELLIKLNQTVAGVTEDLESFHLNTVVSKLMELNNFFEKTGSVSKDSYSIFIRLLYPVAPHLATELWEKGKFGKTIEESTWPSVDEKYLASEEIELVVQINGKVRGKIKTAANQTDEQLKKIALEDKKIKEQIGSQEIIKTFVVKNKLVSIVVK